MPKQEYANSPAKSKLPTLDDKQAESRTTVLPRARRLEEWKPPVSTRQSKARFRNLLERFRRRNEQDIYEMGMELLWLKGRLPHGEFTNFVVGEMEMHIRTAQRLMKHAEECNLVNRYLPYAPNKSGKGKRDTVSLLEPPEIPDKSELKIQKPRHDSEPLNWTAQECATHLLTIFEKLTGRCTIAEMRDALSAFNEFAGEYIDERDMDRKALRGEEEAES